MFLAISAVLVVWFYRSGSGPMLRMMGGSPDAEHDHAHDHGAHDHAAPVHEDHQDHAASGSRPHGA